MARLHTAWGLAFVTVFVATGIYMQANFPDMHHGDATMRMLIRSAHVYILLSAIPHLLLGIYFTWRLGWRGNCQVFGSFFLMLAPLVFLGAFFFEPAPGRLDRPVALAGIVCLIAGTALHGLVSWQPRPSAPAEPARHAKDQR